MIYNGFKIKNQPVAQENHNYLWADETFLLSGMKKLNKKGWKICPRQ